MRVWPGHPYPLGAVWDGAGVNVALFADKATKVELCLFDSPEDRQESQRIELTERTYNVFHGYFPPMIREFVGINTCGSIFSNALSRSFIAYFVKSVLL